MESQNKIKTAGIIALALVIFLSIAILFFSFYANPVLGDEGVVAMDGWRISGGEVPQRDFFQFIPPLSGYVQAMFFKIFSASVFSLRLAGLIYGVLLVILSFFLYRTFIKNVWVLAALLSIFIKYGVAPWFYGSHHWLCDILQIAGAIFLIRSLESRSNLLSAISGIFLGLAVFTLQDQGGYAVIGILAAGIFFKDRKIFLISGAAAILTFLLLALPFAILTSPMQLFNDWVLFPVFQYKAPLGNKFTFANYLQNFLRGVGTAYFKVSPVYTSSIFTAAIFLFLSPLLCPLSLIYLFMKKTLSKKEFAVLTIFSLAFLLGAFHRLAMTNLSWAFPLALLPFFIFLDSLTASKTKLLKAAAYSISLIIITAMTVFAGIRFSWFMNKPLRMVETPRGNYRMLNAGDAREIQELVTAIRQKVGEKEPLFTTGYIPLINFLTDHPNPTKFNFMMPGGYYSLEQVTSWNRSIDERKIKWGIGEKAVFDTEMARLLLPQYEVVFENSKFMLFKRKEAVRD